MKKIAILILLVSFVVGCSKTEPEAETSQKTKSPKEVLSEFFIALLSKDEAVIRKLILPNPDAQILWKGQTTSPQDRRGFEKQLSNMTCRECKVGEIIDLPGGRKLEVTSQMVNDKSKLIFPVIDGQPMEVPLPVIMVDGKWKIEAGPIIFARLLAKQLKEKEKSN